MNPEKRQKYLNITDAALAAAKESSLRNKDTLAKERVDCVKDHTPLDVYINYRNGDEYRQKLENLIKFLKEAGPTTVVGDGAEVVIESMVDGEQNQIGTILVRHQKSGFYPPIVVPSGIPLVSTTKNRLFASILNKSADPDITYPDPERPNAKVKICKVE